MKERRSQTSSRVPIASSTWFITGINRGLGRSIAEEVMRRGGRVAGTVRNLAHADQVKKQFPDQLWVRALDLSDLTNIANVFQAAVGGLWGSWVARVHRERTLSIFGWPTFPSPARVFETLQRFLGAGGNRWARSSARDGGSQHTPHELEPSLVPRIELRSECTRW